jgi:subtilisin-like proprotein convertase family protein
MKNFFTRFSSAILCSIAFFIGANQAFSEMQRKIDFSEKTESTINARSQNYVVKNAYRDIYTLVPFLKNEQVTTALMAACPGSIVVSAGPGACGSVVNFDFALTPLVPVPPDITIEQTSVTNVVNSTIYCSTGQTRYRRTFQHGGPTDLNVNYIRLGVFQANNDPVITINFYVGGNLIGSSTGSVPGTLNNTFYDFLISGVVIPAVSAFDVEIVTPAPFVQIFKLGRNDGGHPLGISEATITSSSCTNPQLVVEGVVGGDAMLFSVFGTPEEYEIEKLPNTGGLPNNTLNSGDLFPIGISYMRYRVTDAYGNILLTCPFTITVNPYANAVTSLACKGQVNVSLDGKCQAVLSSAQLLEGDNYGCFNTYTVNVTALNGSALGNIVGKAQLGQRLNYTVTGPNGNSCWGEILVEDKFGPEMICNDIYTTCSSPLTPGSAVSPRVTVPAIIANGSLTDQTPNSISYVIPVKGLNNSTINDLNVFIDVEHTRVSDLAATITSPDGMTITLFLNPGGSCTGDNLVVTMDDEAPNTHNTLVATCEPTIPAISGRFRPLAGNLLNIFDGKPLNGNWTVTIFDMVAGEGGTVKHIDLIFTQSGATVSFPTPNPVTWSHVAENIYLVNGIDNCSAATLSYTDTVIEEDCASFFSKVIRRCWTGTDALGNNGPPCCQIIYVYRNGLSTLQFPPNYDGIQAPVLSCLEYGTEVPGTDITGLPFGDLCYNVQILEPTDVRVDICKNSYKLIRTHKVIEWCSGQVIVHNQIIKVADEDGPDLECPDNVTINADDYTCSATYLVPKPQIYEECSDVLIYSLSYFPAGDLDDEYPYEVEFLTTNVNQNTGVISGLPLGHSWIKWTVQDECGNISQCHFRVTVIDEVRPTAVCDQITKVSIGGTGISIVDALTFDDGSHDNCGIFSYEVLRMDNGQPCLTSGGNLWKPTVQFCCADIGNTIMVSMRVTDLYGNSNTCMVEVLVEDKLPPFITYCPKDITLNCQADYTDFSVTGEAVAVDNCGIKSLKHQDDPYINQCGVGYINRTWTVEDNQGFRHSCVQVITLVDSSPFKESDITWPKNYETKICHSVLDPSTLPAGFNYPTVADDNCSLVAYHYKDQIFKFVDGACEKILRTWTVIDWCTYNENYPQLGYGWYERIQIIKLNNDIAPIFETPCEDRTFQIFGSCDGPVDFTMTGIDDCPEDNTNLIWKYELFTETGTTPIAVVNSPRFFRTMTPGKYKVRWTIEDKCGNHKICTHYITVVDAKKPTPYCLTSITTAVMNSDGTIAIWAKDYDLGSFDNCTHQDSLWFTFDGDKPVASKLHIRHYFKGNGLDASEAEYLAGVAQVWIPESKSSGILFDCQDIPDGKSQEITVNMWITDEAFNQDYCTVKLILQDNSDFCPDQSGDNVLVTGKILTADNKAVKGVKMQLQANLPELNKNLTTDLSGAFMFNQLPKQYNYTVTASMSGEVMAGVSTLDLVFMQRHILGMDNLLTPYQIIAADIDNNAKVTAADLVALRKVILGITNEFPNNQKSWRLLAGHQTFPNPSLPFPFNEQYVYNQLTTNKVNQNFIAVKIGDVNNSIVMNANEEGTEARTKNVLSLEVPAVSAEINDMVEVPFYAADFDDIFGYQFTLKFDPEVVTFERIKSGALNITEGNFGSNRADAGILTTSWSSETAVSRSSDEVLFTLVFRSNKNMVNSQLLAVSSEITPAAAFNDLNTAMNVQLGVRTQATQTANDGFELYQNTPNPFNENTSISFRIPEAGSVKLNVYDLSGKLVKNFNGYYEAGMNDVQIRKSDVGTSGVYYYKVEYGNHSSTRKMILIE